MRKMFRHIFISGILLVALAFVQVNFAQSNKETLTDTNITGKESEPLIEAKLLTDNEGWVRTKSRILWTKNAGLSWSDITPQPATSSINSVFFLNRLKGWVIKSLAPRDKFSDSFLEIAQTHDGGKTWKETTIQNLGDDFASLFGGDASLNFIDETHGWMLLRQMSNSNFSRGRLFVTDDGGESWNELPSPPIFSQLQFINPNDGWLAGGTNGKELYVTHNGGKKWSRFHLKVSGENDSLAIYSLPKFQDETVGILPVSYTEKDKVIVKFFETKNRGYKWKLKTSLTLKENSDNFTKTIFSLVEPESIIAASPINKGLYFIGADNFRSDVLLNLLPNEIISAIDFNNKDMGWLLTTSGNCEGFKTNCFQKTRLLRVNSAGNLQDISPTVEKVSEIIELNPLSDLVVVSNNKGFDKCEAASTSQMQVWWNSSPYFDVNIYFGGENRASGCPQSNLNSSWVTQVFVQGWKLIPTWVGPQAPCTTCSTCSVHSSDPTTATNQGRTEADRAFNALATLGLNPQTIVYYDMEAYNSTTSCSTAVRAFLNGWVQRTHERGNIAGVYGSPTNAANDWSVISNPPDAVWIAKWDDRVTVWGLTPLSDTLWSNNQRIHQYHGGHNESYGGVTFSIDNDISGGPVAGSGGGGTPPGSFTLTLTPECSGTDSQIRLNWTASSGANSYDIYRNGSLYDSGITGLQYINSANITAGTSYSYFVQARNTVGSTNSNTQSATVPNCTPTPTITTSVASLPGFGNITVGQNSSPQSYTVSGSNLSANIAIQALTGFQISLSSTSGFTSTLNLTQSGGSVPTTTIFARFSPQASGTQSGNISHTSSGAALKNVSVSGNGTTGGMPDLVVDALTAPSAGTIGEWISISVTVRNQGTAAAGPYRVGFYFSTDATITTADVISTTTCNASGLNAGSSSTGCSTDIRVPSTLTPGMYYVGVIADDQNAVSESNENNNTRSAGPVVLSSATTPNNRRRFDFDGDGKTDIGIYRPSLGEWWINRSSDSSTWATQFGNSADRIAPADFTGDGKTDIGFWRPSTGEWFVLRSENFTYYSFPFGTNGDIPAPGDFDGDGRADQAVFRPSNATWYIFRSSGGTTIEQFGANGDVPVVGNYDGDNRDDIAIWRPSTGVWWLSRSSLGVVAYQFGISTDKPAPGDYTGDGKADAAFFRPSNGNWFVLRSENQTYYSGAFGQNGDIASPGDYDGDGKNDCAVFRPSNSTWYVQRSTNINNPLIQTFGIAGDKPAPSAFVP